MEPVTAPVTRNIPWKKDMEVVGVIRISVIELEQIRPRMGHRRR